MYGCSTGTVRRWVRRYRENNDYSRLPGSGRKRIVSDEVIREIILKVKRNRLVSCREIQEELGLHDVSLRTIRRMIRLHSPFKTTWSIRRPFISPANRKKRVKWCKEHLKWTIDDWKRVLWSDECIFSLHKYGKFRYWKKWREVFSGHHYIPTSSKYKSIHIWGCFNSDGTGDLQLVEGKIKSKSYIAMLKNNLKATASTLFGDKRWIFQQDNAKPHVANYSKQFFKSEGIQLLPWPAQSPDLSPIENLWAILKKGIRHKKQTNLQCLIKSVVDVWEKLEASTLTALVESMPKRCQMVIANKGHPIKF